MSIQWPGLLGSNARHLCGGLPHSPSVSRSNSWCRYACWSESLGLVEGSRSDPDWSSSNHNIFILLIIPLIYYIFYRNFIPDNSKSVPLVQVDVALVLGVGKALGVALKYFNSDILHSCVLHSYDKPATTFLTANAHAQCVHACDGWSVLCKHYSQGCSQTRIIKEGIWLLIFVIMEASRVVLYIQRTWRIRFSKAASPNYFSRKTSLWRFEGAGVSRLTLCLRDKIKERICQSCA